MADRKIAIGNLYEMMPEIRKKLGRRCPNDDVLKEILTVFTEVLFDRINKVMTLQHLDNAKNYNPSLPTTQEMFEKIYKEKGGRTMYVLGDKVRHMNNPEIIYEVKRVFLDGSYRIEPLNADIGKAITYATEDCMELIKED